MRVAYPIRINNKKIEFVTFTELHGMRLSVVQSELFSMSEDGYVDIIRTDDSNVIFNHVELFGYRIGFNAWKFFLSLTWTFWFRDVAVRAAVTFRLCRLLPRDVSNIICRMIVESCKEPIWMPIGGVQLSHFEMTTDEFIATQCPDIRLPLFPTQDEWRNLVLSYIKEIFPSHCEWGETRIHKHRRINTPTRSLRVGVAYPYLADTLRSIQAEVRCCIQRAQKELQQVENKPALIKDGRLTVQFYHHALIPKEIYFTWKSIKKV